MNGADEGSVGVEQGPVEVEDRDDGRTGCQVSAGRGSTERLARPRNSPDSASSSQRAPHDRQAHESRRSERQVQAVDLVALQNGHWKCPRLVAHVSRSSHGTERLLTSVHPCPTSDRADRWSTTSCEGRVAVLTINRPEARNAVNGDVANGIEAAIDRLEEDDDVWVGIVTGAGARVLRRRRPQGDRQRPGRAARRPSGAASAASCSASATKPIIAAVDGPALAGGTRDRPRLRPRRRVDAAPRFGIPEVKRSWSPRPAACSASPARSPATSPWRWPSPATRSPPSGPTTSAWSTSSCERGQALDAAHGAGRAHRAPTPRRRAGEPRRSSSRPPTPTDEVGWKMSAEAMAEALQTEDFAEGLTAFIEKRAPDWKGR